MFLPARTTLRVGIHTVCVSLVWEQSVQFEELLEVVSQAVAKLNIDWPLEEQDEHPKSKFDQSFLRL